MIDFWCSTSSWLIHSGSIFPKVNSVLSELVLCLLFECFILSSVRYIDTRVTVATLRVGVDSVKILSRICNQRRYIAIPCDGFPVVLSFVDGNDHGVFHFLENFK